MKQSRERQAATRLQEVAKRRIRKESDPPEGDADTDPGKVYCDHSYGPPSNRVLMKSRYCGRCGEQINFTVDDIKAGKSDVSESAHGKAKATATKLKLDSLRAASRAARKTR